MPTGVFLNCLEWGCMQITLNRKLGVDDLMTSLFGIEPPALEDEIRHFLQEISGGVQLLVDVDQFRRWVKKVSALAVRLLFHTGSVAQNKALRREFEDQHTAFSDSVAHSI
eukprot:Lankesteria_metandrocarpae@DN6312_c0_g1_i1.p1